MVKNYLDKNGLSHFWQKIKKYISNYDTATPTANGFMSSADKSKLDKLSTEAEPTNYLKKSNDSLTGETSFKFKHKKISDGVTYNFETNGGKITFDGSVMEVVSGKWMSTLTQVLELGNGIDGIKFAPNLDDVAVVGAVKLGNLKGNFSYIEPNTNSNSDVFLELPEKEGTLITKEDLLDLAYPIGRGFIDFTDTDYTNYLGGTWERELIGMFPVGYDLSQTEFNTIGKTGGEKRHKLTINEIPSHNHGTTIKAGSSSWGPDYQSGVSHAEQNGNIGGGQDHNNLPPYKVVAYWKRVS